MHLTRRTALVHYAALMHYAALVHHAALVHYAYPTGVSQPHKLGSMMFECSPGELPQ